MKPSKAANLVNLVEAYATSAAYAGEAKPTPSKSDWNKMVQIIGTAGSKGTYLRVPYAYGLTLLPVWTAAYKAAKAGHTPPKTIKLPAKKARAPRAVPAPAPVPMSALPVGTTFRVNEDGSFTVC